MFVKLQKHFTDEVIKKHQTVGCFLMTNKKYFTPVCTWGEKITEFKNGLPQTVTLHLEMNCSEAFISSHS